ncbi:MAG: CoA transferase [Gammaproteobacteria bacterium]|nr:CoA transferase [Gammaproteobacteria bacterium]MBT5053107.1 CoA transferase [Gammaproteobacteria bacterium]
MAETFMTQAFSGIQILDFTQVFAGPFAVMQLALLGADVIKIEQPGTGDQTRGLMNASNDQSQSPSFLTMNANKRSLTLNLKSPEAVDLIKQLIETTDVVVENFKAGTMTKLGLDYECLKAFKPDLIYCSITGYGQSGPKAGEAAYDGAIQAASGMMSQNGHLSSGPTRTGFMPVDMATALSTAFAISASLHRKATTGLGQYIDSSMLDTAIVMQASQFSNYLNQGQLLGLQGNASPTGQPTANVFPTQDGFIQITALKQNQIEQLFDALECSERLKESAFNDPLQRKQNPAVVNALLCEKLQGKTTHAWMNILPKKGIPTAEVKTIPEVLEDPQLLVREVIEQVAPTDANAESIHIIKAGYAADQDGPSITRPPPKLGEHTQEILLSLNLTSSEIDTLRSLGVI